MVREHLSGLSRSLHVDVKTLGFCEFGRAASRLEYLDAACLVARSPEEPRITLATRCLHPGITPMVTWWAYFGSFGEAASPSSQDRGIMMVRGSEACGISSAVRKDCGKFCISAGAS